jgi:hypothetical protein
MGFVPAFATAEKLRLILIDFAVSLTLAKPNISYHSLDTTINSRATYCFHAVATLIHYTAQKIPYSCNSPETSNTCISSFTPSFIPNQIFLSKLKCSILKNNYVCIILWPGTCQCYGDLVNWLRRSKQGILQAASQSVRFTCSDTVLVYVGFQ